MNNYSLSIITKDTQLIIATGDKKQIEKLYKSWKSKMKSTWVEVPLDSQRTFLRTSEIIAVHMQETIDIQNRETISNPKMDTFLKSARFTDEVLSTDLGYK